MSCEYCPNIDVCSARHLWERFSRAEHFVGIGFRCCLAGYETGDINCWETGWRFYSSELGPESAKRAVTDLACWVQTVRTGASRKIKYYPVDCTEFWHDECIGVAMIAACQHKMCPTIKTCARALTGSVEIIEASETARNFASALQAAGITLNTKIISETAAFTQKQPALS